MGWVTGIRDAHSNAFGFPECGGRIVKKIRVPTRDYRKRIVRDPAVCGGEPIFKGTRVTLRTVLASFAEGATHEEILADFPTLAPEDVAAAVAFAAVSAQEDLPVPELPLVS